MFGRKLFDKSFERGDMSSMWRGRKQFAAGIVWLLLSAFSTGAMAQNFVDWSSPSCRNGNAYSGTTNAYYTVLLLAHDPSGQPISGAALYIQLDGDSNWYLVGSTGTANSLGSGYPGNLQGQRINLSAHLNICASVSSRRAPGFRLKVAKTGHSEVVVGSVAASAKLQRGVSVANRYIYYTSSMRSNSAGHARAGSSIRTRAPSNATGLCAEAYTCSLRVTAESRNWAWNSVRTHR